MNDGLRIINVGMIFILALFVAGIGVQVYAEADLSELKKTLKEQEKQIVLEQKETGPRNRGYIYSGSSSEVETQESLPTPVYVASDTQSQIKDLYRKAAELFKQGKLEDAKKCLEELIELNPLHVPARSFLKRIVDLQTELSERDNIIMNRERMMEVDKAWLPPERIKTEQTLPVKKRSVKTKGQLVMEEKARQNIPEINFTDAHLRDVLKYLSEISGINIVIDEDLFPKRIIKEEVPSEVELLTAEQSGASVTQALAPISDRITISLTNIPLIEALKYILSAKGLKYRIDEYAIVVSTLERLAEVEMETCYYHLSAGVGIFTEFAKRVREEGEKGIRGIAKGLETKARITIKDVLEQSGVPFPPGSNVFLDQRTGTLIVRNIPANLALVEEVLRILDITPFQVEIEARFIELTQTTSQELGLEWMVKGGGFFFDSNRQFRLDSDIAYDKFGQYTDGYGKEGFTRGLRYLSDIDSITGKDRDLTAVNDIIRTGGKDSITKKILSEVTTETSPGPGGNLLSISGILTEPQFRMIIHALNQSGYADVLSAPKVTTLNNQQAQIEVVKEIIYPTEFELTPATTNDSGTVVTQPVVTPAAWTTRDVGIILNVTPSVGADRKTINLTLLPEVSLLKGWNDYGIPASTGKWNRIRILQPIFFTKNVATNVVVHDGETVVLGGLIKEELVATEDKIPLLGDIPIIGRLFRSETEQSHKTNLLIFVTANLLTPTGEQIRK